MRIVVSPHVNKHHQGYWSIFRTYTHEEVISYLNQAIMLLDAGEIIISPRVLREYCNGF